MKIIWTTFAEFPGTLLAFALIDWIGRKKTLAFLSFSFAVSTLGVIECAASKTILIILLFCSRGAATGLLQSAYVYTSEAYPTNLRAVALGKLGTTFSCLSYMILTAYLNPLGAMPFYVIFTAFRNAVIIQP